MKGVEVLHPKVVEALRAMSGAQRLRLAHEEWRLVRERLTVFLAARHPEWDPAEVRRQVAKRLRPIMARAHVVGDEYNTFTARRRA